MHKQQLNYKMYEQENKYVIEGDDDGGNCEYDFFSQIKNMLNMGENDNNNNTDETMVDDCCLLSKEALSDIHVTLLCGHKFNYMPLYKEVVMQKTTSGLSTNGYYNLSALRTNEIKCPYCRAVQCKVLPFLNYDGVRKLKGVNGPESMCMKARACDHVEVNKKKVSCACKSNAIHVINGVNYCKKHYENKNEKQNQNKDDDNNMKEENGKCGVILKSGKNKGTACTNSSNCRIHKKIT